MAKLNWSEPSKTLGGFSQRIWCNTPVGYIVIKWYENTPVEYTVMIEDESIGVANSLNLAKELAHKYLVDLGHRILEFVKDFKELNDEN